MCAWLIASSSSSQPVGFFVRWQFQRRQGQLTLYTTITQLPCHFFSQQAPPTFTLLPSRQRSFPSKSFRDDFIFSLVDIFQERKIRNDGSWERREKKSFPQKSVGRRACMCVCGQSPWFFFLWLGRGGKVGGGGGGIPVAPSRLYASLVSPLPITLLCFFPPFVQVRMEGECKKNIGERDWKKRSLEEHLEMVGGGSLSLHPASIFPPVWIP